MEAEKMKRPSSVLQQAQVHKERADLKGKPLEPEPAKP